MKSIALFTGETAIVDDGDYDLVAQYKWRRLVSPDGMVYARGREINSRPPYRSVLMHRLITRARKEEQVDHRDGNGLNNTRRNLVPGTASGNQRSFKRKLRRCYSRFRGVTWYKSNRKWGAILATANNRRFLGLFEREIDAAKAWNAAAVNAGYSESALNTIGPDENSLIAICDCFP